MEENKKIQNILDRVHVSRLTQSEREKMWHGVVSKPASKTWFVFPFMSLDRNIMLATLALIGILAIGGGTAMAADNAKPGDVLFSLDRAVEDLRLKLATNAESKNELRVKFSEERVKEVKGLIEDRKSKNSDDAHKGEETARVATGIKSATAFLDKAVKEIEDSADADDAKRIQSIIDGLNDDLSNIPEDLRVDLRNDDNLKIKFDNENSGVGDDKNNRLDIRTDDGRIRIEVKDGEVRIKEDGRNKDDDAKNDDDRKDDSRTISGTTLEIEADVFTDKTVVQVELNDRKTQFTTSSKTKEAIIRDVLTRYPTLTRAQVEAAFDLEIEDRASHADD